MPKQCSLLTSLVIYLVLECITYTKVVSCVGMYLVALAGVHTCSCWFSGVKTCCLYKKDDDQEDIAWILEERTEVVSLINWRPICQVQEINENFLPCIMKVVKPERDIKYNDDFYYLHIFTVIHSPKDISTDKLLSFLLIIDYSDGEKWKLKHCCSDSISRYFPFFSFSVEQEKSFGVNFFCLLYYVSSLLKVKFSLTLLVETGFLLWFSLNKIRCEYSCFIFKSKQEAGKERVDLLKNEVACQVTAECEGEAGE